MQDKYMECEAFEILCKYFLAYIAQILDIDDYSLDFNHASDLYLLKIHNCYFSLVQIFFYINLFTV